MHRDVPTSRLPAPSTVPVSSQSRGAGLVGVGVETGSNWKGLGWGGGDLLVKVAAALIRCTERSTSRRLHLQPSDSRGRSSASLFFRSGFSFEQGAIFCPVPRWGAERSWPALCPVAVTLEPSPTSDIGTRWGRGVGEARGPTVSLSQSLIVKMLHPI